MSNSDNREILINELEAYIPFNEQELMDKSVILNELRCNKDVLVRNSLTGHITASAWIVNHKRDKVLMIYHNIYNSWAWTGGHADGDIDLMRVALKEVREESGIEHIKPAAEGIYSLEIIPVYGHVKRGKYVPSHLHYNFTYIFEADESDELRIKPDENSGAAWISVDKLSEYCSEPWIFERIYRKLSEKVKGMD